MLKVTPNSRYSNSNWIFSSPRRNLSESLSDRCLPLFHSNVGLPLPGRDTAPRDRKVRRHPCRFPLVTHSRTVTCVRIKSPCGRPRLVRPLPRSELAVRGLRRVCLDMATAALRRPPDATAAARPVRWRERQQPEQGQQQPEDGSHVEQRAAIFLVEADERPECSAVHHQLHDPLGNLKRTRSWQSLEKAPQPKVTTAATAEREFSSRSSTSIEEEGDTWLGLPDHNAFNEAIVAAVLAPLLADEEGDANSTNSSSKSPGLCERKMGKKRLRIFEAITLRQSTNCWC